MLTRKDVSSDMGQYPRMASTRRGTTSVGVEEFVTPERRIFLVHGRNLRARQAMVDLLNALDLRVITWEEAVSQTGFGTPYTGDVIAAGMGISDAVVVLLTPDDLGKLKEDFVTADDRAQERDLTGQPRMNVIFEAGMAMARDRSKTVLVEIGKIRPMTDTEGLNVVRLGSGEARARHQLAVRLRNVGLKVDMEGGAYLTAGDFGDA